MKVHTVSKGSKHRKEYKHLTSATRKHTEHVYTRRQGEETLKDEDKQRELTKHKLHKDIS